MKRPEPHKLFELESLEQRLLLSGDSLFGALPATALDEADSPLYVEPSVAPSEEVLLSSQDQVQGLGAEESEPYDPSQGLEDIFSGLSVPISDAQQGQATQGLKELVRMGGVLEKSGAFA